LQESPKATGRSKLIGSIRRECVDHIVTWTEFQRGCTLGLKETAKAREAAARKAIESIGGKIESINFTASGEYHVAMIAEYPNAATAAALIAMMVFTGAVLKFNLIELITMSEIDRAYVVLTDPVVFGP
jgi:uncharacterized protein with GYD domain